MSGARHLAEMAKESGLLYEKEEQAIDEILTSLDARRRVWDQEMQTRSKTDGEVGKFIADSVADVGTKDERDAVLALYAKGDMEGAKKAGIKLFRKEADKRIKAQAKGRGKKKGETVELNPPKTTKKAMENCLAKLETFMRRKVSAPTKDGGKVKQNLHTVQFGDTVLSMFVKLQGTRCVGVSAAVTQGGEQVWQGSKTPFIL
jgi:hypothetical protein